MQRRIYLRSSAGSGAYSGVVNAYARRGTRSIRPTNGRPKGSPASINACAKPLSCPARSLSRALATDCACCASLPRPDPCPLPSQHRLNSAAVSHSDATAAKKKEIWLPPLQLLKSGACTRHSPLRDVCCPVLQGRLPPPPQPSDTHDPPLPYTPNTRSGDDPLIARLAA
jgi:hypothetical protein